MTKNTTLNLPEELIAKTRIYAAHQGTTMTALIREYLEALTRSSEAPRQDDTLRAYAEGLITRREAVERLGVRDGADLLIALGESGLPPPGPPPHVVEAQAVLFAALWRSLS